MSIENQDCPGFGPNLKTMIQIHDIWLIKPESDPWILILIWIDWFRYNPFYLGKEVLLNFYTGYPVKKNSPWKNKLGKNYYQIKKTIKKSGKNGESQNLMKEN